MHFYLYRTVVMTGNDWVDRGEHGNRIWVAVSTVALYVDALTIGADRNRFKIYN